MKKQKTLVETLISMKGNTYTISGKQHVILSYTLNENLKRVTITTDLQQFEKTFDNIEQFINLILGGGSNAVTLYNDDMDVSSNDHNGHDAFDPKLLLSNYITSADSLIAVLKDNIEKVKNSKEYVPQAAVVCNTVNNIISIEKLKLDMYKEMKSLKTQPA